MERPVRQSPESRWATPTLQPALALMLAEHFHHPPRGSEKFVVRHGRSVPLAFGLFKEGFQPVGERLIRSKDAEILLLMVQFLHIAQEWPQHMRVTNAAHPGDRKS